MATRRIVSEMAAHTAGANGELVRVLLNARSRTEASLALSILRSDLPERDIVHLANIRELIAELPLPPFSTPWELLMLRRILGYESSTDGVRMAFDCDGGVFGIEFLGEGKRVDRIILLTVAGRVELSRSDEEIINSDAVELLFAYEELADRLVEALLVLGITFSPRFYMSVNDYFFENAHETSLELDGLF